MVVPTYRLPPLPPPADLETVPVLREASRANRFLGELKGRAANIPNPGILIDTLSLQEALASSAIESIVTTQDEAFQASLEPEIQMGPAKEVALYHDALKCGFDRMRGQQMLLTSNTIVEMFQLLKRTQGGFRETPGTAPRNDQTGDIVYVPPQDASEIVAQMQILEAFINDDSASTLDPLIKMAVIHHQFESIHPFPDGNGRIGRIINVLYLTRVERLSIPILYMSRYITGTKSEYYRLLQAVRETGEWEDWLVYMLRGVAETSEQTLGLIDGIKALMAEYKERIRSGHPKMYSQDLLNNLFRHPYTRIDLIERDLQVTRQTASRYLKKLADAGLLRRQKIRQRQYYINTRLLDLFITSPGRPA